MRHDRGIAGSADQEIRSPSARGVNIEGLRGVESILMDVANYSYHRTPARLGIEPAQVDALADGICAGPESLRQCGIDNDVGTGPILLGEQTTVDKRNPDGNDIAEASGSKFSNGTSACGRNGLTFDEEPSGRNGGEAQRKHVDCPYARDAWNPFDALGHLLNFQ